jgi:peroxin-10
MLTRILPAFRSRVRRKLEANTRKATPQGKASSSYRLQSYILEHLDTITSPSPVYAISLATFYFSGAYYQISKRIWGLRYIFTKQLLPSEQRVGYEVLGVLLVLQMAVQSWLHMHHTWQTSAESNRPGGGSAIIDGGVEIGLNSDAMLNTDPIALPQDHSHAGIAKVTHTPLLAAPRYNLKDEETMQWIAGKQQRKCTLCLEELKDPSVTTCGHVFCWTCIGDWCREKPECPLCRQTSLPQHILPLRV